MLKQCVFCNLWKFVFNDKHNPDQGLLLWSVLNIGTRSSMEKSVHHAIAIVFYDYSTLYSYWDFVKIQPNMREMFHWTPEDIDYILPKNNSVFHSFLLQERETNGNVFLWSSGETSSNCYTLKTKRCVLFTQLSFIERKSKLQWVHLQWVCFYNKVNTSLFIHFLWIKIIFFSPITCYKTTKHRRKYTRGLLSPIASCLHLITPMCSKFLTDQHGNPLKTQHNALR